MESCLSGDMTAKKAVAAAAKTIEFYTHKAHQVASLLSVKEIHCKFCPFNINRVSTKYMVQWLQTEAAQMTNSDVKIFTTVSKKLIQYQTKKYLVLFRFCYL